MTAAAVVASYHEQQHGDAEPTDEDQGAPGQTVVEAVAQAVMNLGPPPSDRPAEHASRYVAAPPGPLLLLGEPYLHVVPFTDAHPTLMVITARVGSGDHRRQVHTGVVRSHLDRTRQAWEQFGETDPMWGVLAHDGMRGRWQPEEFFAHGRAEVDALMTQLQMAGVDAPRDRVLDFGCGVGRLSFALADHFEQVVGVDISRPMLGEAGKYNRLGDRCQFFLYNGEDLSLFPDRSFSAVISLMTLQHVPPAAATVYLAEMVRVLRPGGVLAVQIPAERRQPNLSQWRRLRRAVRTSLELAIRRRPRMEMHAMPIAEVAAVIEAAGADIAGVIPDGRAGEWGDSVLHVAVRRAPDGAGPRRVQATH